MFGGDLLYDGWEPVARTAVLTVAGYAVLVAVLRISGKRTLAQLNIFDWVVTVALGSTLASMIVARDVALVQGATALATLVALQLVVAWLTTRAGWARRVVKSEPTVLVSRGEFRREALDRERVSEAEVVQAIRSEGFGSLDEVGAVILETNGRLSVLRASDRLPTVPDA